MKKIEIGRIVEITNSDIIVEVLKKYESSHIIIEGNAIRLTGVGSFLRVGSLIYQINTEKIIDINDKIERSKISIDKKLICSIIGYFENDLFKEGINGEVPDLYQKVYKITQEEENLIYNINIRPNTLKLGSLLLNKKVDFNIDINKLIASHILIVGNTGSGKSNTLASIYENLFAIYEQNIIDSKSKFLIIDTNGEYFSAFSKSNKLISRKALNVRGKDSNSLKMPIRSLDENDWRILLEATDKTQFPIIKKVVISVRRSIFENRSSKDRILNFINWRIKDVLTAIIDSKENPSSKLSGFLKINETISYYLSESKEYSEVDSSLANFIDSIDINNTRLKWKNTDIYSDNTTEIKEKVKNTDILKGTLRKYSINELELLINLEYLLRIYKYNISENNISPMISRFVSNKSVYEKIFDSYDLDKPINYQDFEYLLFNRKSVALCDLSMAGKDISRSVVSLIASKLFDNAIDLRSKNELFTYHILIDEAHNYLSRFNIQKEDAISESCIEIFEKIIKEGRKFNTFLTMSTQRPSEITPTLLSQSHNYIIHKLVNPNDISVITNTVPFLDSMSAKMIPILSPGAAIFSGTAFPKPNLVKVNLPKYSVKSETIDLGKLWNKS